MVRNREADHKSLLGWGWRAWALAQIMVKSQSVSTSFSICVSN